MKNKILAMLLAIAVVATGLPTMSVSAKEAGETNGADKISVEAVSENNAQSVSMNTTTDASEEQPTNQSVAETAEETVKEDETMSADTAAQIIDSGSCGENATYTLDSEGTLTISGTGAVEGVVFGNNWVKQYDYKDFIKKVVIASGITRIAEEMFVGCEALMSVEMASTVTRIGHNAFEGCINLTTVELSSKLETIESNVFSGCERLISIELPDSLKEIGSSAFSGCESLKEIEIPENILIMESGVFSYCKGLESIILPEGLTDIENYAFEGCSSLKEIEIPIMVIYIGDGAFYGCKTLEKIEIPRCVRGMGDGVFNNCSSLESITVDENNPSYSDYEGVLYNLKKTKLIRCPQKKDEIMIPVSVTTIGEGAFEGCCEFEEIELPESVNNIERYAFEGCSEIYRMEIPSGVTTIAYGLFLDCTSLEKVKFPLGITEIGEWAFAGCTSLEKIKLPGGIRAVPANLFYRCESLTKVEMYDNINVIDESAFAYCTSLETIVFPMNLNTICSEAFKGCVGLKSIELPQNLLEIGSAAFGECTSLTEVELPIGVGSVAGDAFSGCTALNDIEVAAANKSYVSVDGVLYNYAKTTLVACPNGKSGVLQVIDGVTKIEDFALSGCKKITTVKLPKEIFEITLWSFRWCPELTAIDVAEENEIYSSVDGLLYDKEKTELILCPEGKVKVTQIPSSVVTIKKDAFWASDKLQQVVIPEGVEIIEENFNESLNLKKVTIPTSVIQMDENCFVDLEEGECDVTIYCKENSYAHQYAKKHGLKYSFANADDDIKLSNAKVTLSATNFYYDGSAKRPAVTVKMGAVTLRQGVDYTVSYVNNVNVGTATVTVSGIGEYKGSAQVTFTISIKNGATYTVGAYKYTVKNTEVAFAGLANAKTTKVTIPNSVNIGGKVFRVTSIADKALRKTKVKSVVIGNNVTKVGNSAFESCGSLKSVTVGTAVKTIGKSAFKNCKKLTKLTVKSKKLKSVGKNAFKGINAKCKIKVPNAKLKAYKKLMKNKGQKSSVKITK